MFRSNSDLCPAWRHGGLSRAAWFWGDGCTVDFAGMAADGTDPLTTAGIGLCMLAANGAPTGFSVVDAIVDCGDELMAIEANRAAFRLPEQVGTKWNQMEPRRPTVFDF